MDIGKLRQRVMQNLNHVRINLDRRGLSGAPADFRRQHADARPDFQDKIILVKGSAFSDSVDDIRINQEILSKTFRELKSIFIF
jgi:hypothetical protein